MIALEDHDGILFARAHEVATLTPEWRGRWRAVLHDGTVVHRPSTPPPGPWVPLGDSLVWPGHLKRHQDTWEDPAGFRYPGDSLPELDPPLSPVIPELGCREDDVLALRPTQGGCIWQTDTGDIPWSAPTDQASELHGNLIAFFHGVYVNRTRLQRIRKGDGAFSAVLDDGSVLGTFQHKDQKAFAQRLGLPHFSHLEPRVAGFSYDQFRDYPVELMTASAEQLKTWFVTPRQLIANVIFQAVRQPELGISNGYGEDHRGFWYRPVHSALCRAGFLNPTERSHADKELWDLYGRILQQKIGDHRLFTYRDLGFADPQNGTIGQLRPNVLLVLEKESLRKRGEHLAQKFGVSLIVTGGSPALLDSEFLARRLAAFAPVRLIYCVDYDPPGWGVADATRAQLQACGLEIAAGDKFLVRADSFTEEELSLHAIPCASAGPAAALTRKWVQRSGGIHGRALGIYANHLYPVARLEAEMARALAGD